jgi:hypothetical protein
MHFILGAPVSMVANNFIILHACSYSTSPPIFMGDNLECPRQSEGWGVGLWPTLQCQSKLNSPLLSYSPRQFLPLMVPTPYKTKWFTLDRWMWGMSFSSNYCNTTYWISNFRFYESTLLCYCFLKNDYPIFSFLHKCILILSYCIVSIFLSTKQIFYVWSGNLKKACMHLKRMPSNIRRFLLPDQNIIVLTSATLQNN